jgi:cellulose synthase operon protein C
MAIFSPSPIRNALFCAALIAALSGCGGKSEAELADSGKQLLAQKDFAGAIIQFKSALQKQDTGEVRLLLGKALLETGDPVSAAVELRKALELQAPEEEVVPALARAMLLLGEESKVLSQFGDRKLKDTTAQADLLTSLATAHLVRGDPDKAGAAIGLAQQNVPGFVPAVVLDARILASQGNFDGALALLDKALLKAPDDQRAGLLQAEILWRGKKDPGAALDSFRKVLAAHPKAVTAHTSVITILADQKKPEEAKAQFEQLKKAVPNHPDTLFYEAQFAFSKGDYKVAREITDRLLKAMPEHPRVLELAGSADYRERRYIEAEASLSKALKIAPGLPVARMVLAQTYLRTNQPSKAIDVLMPVIQSKQPTGVVMALAGEAWLQLGDVKKSEAAFAKAAELAPEDNRIRTSVALSQMARGDGAAAVAQLEAIAADDKGPRADVALISARLRQGDLNGALKAIDGLQAKTPDRPVAYNLRGRVLLLKRDIAGASQAFEAALSKDPNYFPAVASLAAIDLDGGKPEAARKRFEDLLKAEPKSYQAALALAELGVRTGATPADVQAQLRRAVAANPSAPAAHLALVKQLMGSDPKAALTAAQEGTAALPNNLEVTEALGRAQLAAKQAQQAVSTFKQLASLQTTNPGYQLLLAEAFSQSGDTTAARKALEQSLQIKPDFVPAQRALVGLALRDKRPDDALALVRAMQKSDPKDAQAYLLEGDVEGQRRNWAAAEAAFRKALALNRNTEAAIRMHATLAAAGKAAEATRFGADWAKEHPKDAAFRYYLGDVAMGKGDDALAESHYRGVIALQPRNALALNNVAWLMVKQGKPGALPLAQQANEVLPGRPQLMDTLALALAAENQLPKAIEIQQSAIARNGTDPALKLTLAKLLIKSGDKPYARVQLEELAKLGDRFSSQAEVAQLLKSL